MSYTNTVTIYVDPAGSNSNSGLTALLPLQTLQAAFDLLLTYGPVLDGLFTIQLAAGTYTNGAYCREGLTMGASTHQLDNMAGRLIIQGPSVTGGVPTAIIDGGSSPTTNYGFAGNLNQSFYLKDVKFTNWSTSNSYGLNFTGGCNIILDNVHLHNCFTGVITRLGQIQYLSGILDGGSVGFTALDACGFTVSSGVTIQNCGDTGVIIAENATGHLDSVTINNCPYGVKIAESSHAQVSGTIENSATCGLYVAHNASYFDSGITYTGNSVNTSLFNNAIEIAKIRNFSEYANQGRLTLSSGVPVTTSDVTAATTVYFTPFRGDTLALYNTPQWDVLQFTQQSIAVPATTNTNYDIFAYNNSGIVALEAVAWTNDTTRATALALQNGIYVKSGTPAHRYLGSFRTTATSGRTEDSLAKRYVWNYDNRVQKIMQALEATTSWTYSTNSYRQANANTANQLDFIIGVQEDSVLASLNTAASNSTATPRFVANAIGLDSTTIPYGGNAANPTPPVAALATTCPLTQPIPISAGHHKLVWLECGSGSDTQTWYGVGVRGIQGYLLG